MQPVRNVRRSGADEFDPLRLRLHRQRRHRLVEDFAQAERLVVERQLAGLHLGEIENVVEQRQQRLGTAHRRLGKPPLLVVQRGVEQQAGHADHAVHRRPDLVAHVGQELALGPVGRLGLLAMEAQRLLHLATQADAGHHFREDRQQPPFRLREGMQPAHEIEADKAQAAAGIDHRHGQQAKDTLRFEDLAHGIPRRQCQDVRDVHRLAAPVDLHPLGNDGNRHLLQVLDLRRNARRTPFMRVPAALPLEMVFEDVNAVRSD